MRRDAEHLRDILAAADKVSRYRDALRADTEQLQRDALEDAVLHQLTVVGEAVGRLSPALREATPEVNWVRLKGLRNLITHEYHRVDLAIVWQAVDNHFPGLVLNAAQLLAELEQAGAEEGH